jgi:hypothetical protein
MIGNYFVSQIKIEAVGELATKAWFHSKLA